MRNQSRAPKPGDAEHESPKLAISSKRIFLLFGVNLIGFILLFVVDFFVKNLIDELNQQLQNEQNRVTIGEILTNDLISLESKTYQITSTSNAKTREWIFQNVQNLLGKIHESISVLDKGGRLVRETRLNIESQETMVREINYEPKFKGVYVLETIDLIPKLGQVEEKLLLLIPTLKQREELSKQGQWTEFNKIDSTIKLQLQSFSPLFTRMGENANRLFFESQKNLELISTGLKQRESVYFIFQVSLSLAIIVIVLFIGFRVLNQVAKSNKQLQKLTHSLELQKFAMDQHAIVSITDTKGIITYVNEQFCKISGYQSNDLIGCSHNIIKSSEHIKSYYKELWRTISSGEVWHSEVKNRARNGKTFWISQTIVPFLDTEGKPFQYVSISTDITKRKHMEEDILENNRFLNSLTDAMGEGVYFLDEDGCCHFLNPKAELLLGWSMDELAGKSIHDTVHYQLDEHGNREPSDKCNVILNTSKGNVYRSNKDKFIHKSGKIFPVSLVSEPLFKDGKVAGSVTVFQDITQLKEAERMMSDALEEAKLANKMKSEFLANMSHELRTPMNGILGASDLLESSDLDKEQKQFVSMIHRSGTGLLHLLNDLLDLSKIEAGKMELESVVYDIDELIKHLHYLLDTSAQEKDNSFAIKKRNEIAQYLTGDEIRIQQILINLLGNAIKFTSNGKITLTISLTDNRKKIRFEVNDTGIGISEEAQEKLFVSFQQAESSISRKYGGTGLGLAISKQLVELMHGNIGFESELGKGTRFWFEVPYLESQQPKELKSELEDDMAAVLPRDDIKILLAEDNAVNQLVACKILNKLGYNNVDIVDNGNKAVQKLVKQDYDLVLMDVQMPECDGMEACRQIRGISNDIHINIKVRNPDIPVIALTANAMVSDINACLDAGMNSHIAKPINIKMLGDELEKWL